MTGAGATAPAIELSGICRRFGDVVANDRVDLKVASGGVHAVVGENGAGKSTLMKVAYGQLRPDSGTIRLKGETVGREHSPRQSIGRGVGMVHQHFMLVGPLSVAENVVLGREPTRGWTVDLGAASAAVDELSERFGFDLDSRAKIESLSVGQQQRVEILKVLYQGCDVLILDEPTAVLAPSEVEQLFSVLRGLVAEGVTVVLITHKLDEVMALADAVTVMRAGRVVEEFDLKDADAPPVEVEAIARAMVGRPVNLEVSRAGRSPGEVVLEVEELSALDRAGLPALDRVSLEVHAGEILGIAGVVGNGQTELIECVAGLLQPAGGHVRLAGADIRDLSIAGRFAAGIGHVAEDRHLRGLVLDFSVRENLLLGRQREFAGKWGLDVTRADDYCRQQIADADIRPDDPDAIARGLSGGNQQKIVITRELSRPDLRLLLCAQPTRGVDIGAIELIHRRLMAARDAGCAVLLVSAELSELRSLADRVLVLYRGRVALALDRVELDARDAIERLGAAMTGARRADGGAA